jgi:hypothetical protein
MSKYHQDLDQVVLLLSLKYKLFSKYLKVEIRDKLSVLMYPKTVEWTSGKPGRKQILFQIPEQYRHLFQDFTRLLINSFGIYECAEKEQLEFRYNGCQSVLPPSIHPETGQYHWINSPTDTEVAIAPDWLINFLISQLNPRSNRETKSMNNNSYNKYLADFKLPINKSIPLTICLAPSTRDLLDGVCEGSRNNTGIAVAKDLIGTANYLNSIGQSYQGNVYDLLKQYCQQCSPSLTDKDCQRIYQSAEKSTPKPCLDENKICGCIAAWYWKNSDSPQKYYQNYQNKGKNPQNNQQSTGRDESGEFTTEEIEKRVEEIIENCKSDTQRNLQLNKLARISGVSFSELWRIYQIKLKQFNNEDNLEDLTINLLINCHEQDLNLDDVLPQELARVIVKLAEQIPTAPEALLTALLPVWATGIGTKSKIIVNPSSQYVQPAILRTAIVARSGERKSPTLNLGIDIIEKLEEEARLVYQENYLIYEEELAEYENLSKDEKKQKERPIAPKLKRYLIKDINLEGLIKVHSENPNGLLTCVDELAGYFTRMNKYNNGKGDDEQQDLELFNGKSLIKDRMTYNYYLPKTCLNITGTIQWEVLEKIMKKKGENDPSGSLSRWLFCAKKMPEPYLNLFAELESKEFNDLQRNLFLYLLYLPEQDYFLSNSAKSILQEWQHHNVDLLKKELLEPLAIAIPKFESYLFRIALVLHLVESFFNGELSPTISAETAYCAIILTNWFMGQYRYILAKNSTKVNQEGKILKIKEFLDKKGYATPSKIKNYNRSFSDTTNDEFKNYFNLLVNSNYAVWRRTNGHGLRIEKATYNEQ